MKCVCLHMSRQKDDKLCGGRGSGSRSVKGRGERGAMCVVCQNDVNMQRATPKTTANKGPRPTKERHSVMRERERAERHRTERGKKHETLSCVCHLFDIDKEQAEMRAPEHNATA